MSQQNAENEEKTKKTNHRLTRISKQVMFDLFDRYFLSKKRQNSFNTPLVCSEEKPQLGRQLALAQTFDGSV